MSVYIVASATAGFFNTPIGSAEAASFEASETAKDVMDNTAGTFPKAPLAAAPTAAVRARGLAAELSQGRAPTGATTGRLEVILSPDMLVDVRSTTRERANKLHKCAGPMPLRETRTNKHACHKFIGLIGSRTL